MCKAVAYILMQVICIKYAYCCSRLLRHRQKLRATGSEARAVVDAWHAGPNYRAARQIAAET